MSSLIFPVKTVIWYKYNTVHLAGGEMENGNDLVRNKERRSIVAISL
jgi:hypothetical protein